MNSITAFFVGLTIFLAGLVGFFLGIGAGMWLAAKAIQFDKEAKEKDVTDGLFYTRTDTKETYK